MKKRVAVILLCLFLLAFISCAGRKPKPAHTSMRQVLTSYIGTPYQWGGMNHKGIDCSGLVVRAYAAEGIKLPRTVEALHKVGREVDEDELEFGDLLFFNTKPLAGLSICVCPFKFFDLSMPLVYGQTHVGIYMGNGYFIHAVSSKGVILSKFTSNYWQKRFIAARRIFK